AAIPHHASLQGIFLLYLFVVMWLAVVFGRGPAVAGSVLAFLAYDFFFIPPLYVFTVGRPEEWISLFALLATSLVISQLTAALQARTREAEASQRRTAALYALARLVVETRDQGQLYRELVRRTVAEFAAQGVAACVLLVPDESQGQVMVAAAPEGSPLLAALDLGLRENAGKVAWVFEHASPVGGAVAAAKTTSAEVVRFYLPLMSGRQVIGALGVAGSPAIRRLARETTAKASEQASRPVDGADSTPQVALFRAFRDQIALVLERSALQERAIHNEALQESDRLKNALLGSVTHDLRTPLASIKAAATSLLQPGVEWTPTDRNELLSFIDTSADRLNRLVSNLLDLSRLEAGGAEPVKEWYLINDVIATVLDRLELTGATRDHRVTVEAPPELPLAPFDYGQIEQVLTNLIENALKYSPGGSEIRIEASAPHEGSELDVRVSDQGIGIPASELESIFDKFYRIQHVRLPWQTERPPLGTGLGLAICRSIITAHGGRIWAESREGEGATFIFTLPIPSERPHGRLPDVDRADDAPAPANTARLVERGVSA
ncbi:MAG TPA: ATP-binding protein, partial [Ktedonobacterales bacterium]|nr:ATP-binding protein [Ktedonobacterales bacterium]